MATKPKAANLTAESREILNAVRADASPQYQELVPLATADMGTPRMIGAAITKYEWSANEYLNALVNRIARVLVTSKSYDNPWAVFKKGMLELGETVEEVFVNIAKPFQFDPADAEKTLYKREIPDVRAAFHPLNYQVFYKDTISNEELRQAFLSWDGVTDLIARIVDSMYTAANYDEFQVMKYMLARQLLAGKVHAVEIDDADPKAMVTTVKTVANNFTFMSGDYNAAGVKTHSPHADQYVLLSSAFDAEMDVQVLAAAFNMDKAEFIGRRVLVDGFGKIDTERLSVLFAGDASYQPLTAEELAALDTISAVLVDKDYFMIFDNFMNFTENYNGQGLYWQYFYHVWKTFSVSPFANAAVFVPKSPAVKSVTVAPTAVTLSAGGSAKVSATVETDNFAPQGVSWSSADPSKVSVSADGVVTVLSGATAGIVAVTATSVYDKTKKAICNVTVTA